MSAGYQKAARVLRELDSADREWLLAQFTAEERARLEVVMAAVGAPKTLDAATSDAKTGNDVSREVLPAVSKLATAEATTIEQLLRDEPDWIVALVLTHTAWPWLPKYLGRRPAAELDRIQELARQLEPIVKQPARNAIVAACAGRLDATSPREPTMTPFDRLVAVARRQLESERPAAEGQ